MANNVAIALKIIPEQYLHELCLIDLRIFFRNYTPLGKCDKILHRCKVIITRRPVRHVVYSPPWLPCIAQKHPTVSVYNSTVSV